MSRFAANSPGAEEGAVLALALVNDLLCLLREKGVLSVNDVTGLLKSTANTLGRSQNALDKRGVRFIENTMLPVKETD